MLPTNINLPADQRGLLKLYRALNKQDRAKLLAFAEFLRQCAGEPSSKEGQPSAPPRPRLTLRPSQESVVAAIKRLSNSYFMLNRDNLLTDSSSLMTAHIMRGRPAHDVIDELEELFASQYQDHLSSLNGKGSV